MADHTCAKHPEPCRDCYLQGCCRGQCCRTKLNAYKQQLKLRHARGEVVSIPRDVVRAHVQRLLAIGATRHGIARAAGVRPSTVIAVLDEAKTRPVPAGPARRLLATTPASLPGDALVSGRFARQLLEELVAEGLTWQQIARRGLGWSTWCGQAAWPHARVQMRHVVALRQLLDEVRAPRCEDCDRPPLDGGRWCLKHFQAHADPRLAPTARPVCGTDRGYQAHYRARERACDPCREAHRLRARRAAVAS